MTKTTTFPIVPLYEVPQQVLESAESHHPNVLVVDDDSGIANSLVEILSRSGYSAEAAYDANDALQAALLTPPEILISDVMLPDMNGIDLAILIRRIYPDCTVFLLSGHTTVTELLAPSNGVGHEFVLLNKPVNPVDLLERLSENHWAAS